jgi:catalase-peroxidase
VLEPVADGFRNFRKSSAPHSAGFHLVEKSALLGLTAPEMTVLVGGLRVLDANADGSSVGVLTSRPGTLTNDFFTTLLDPAVAWNPTSDADRFEGRSTKSEEVKWSASRADLVFGSNSQLRAISEVYASKDAQAKFVLDFIGAWNKVMMLDRFDVI